MLSGVLRNERAVAVKIEIMRAFVELRRVVSSHAEVEQKIEELERATATRLGRHDEDLALIFETLRQLITPPKKPKRRVGFGLPERDTNAR